MRVDRPARHPLCTCVEITFSGPEPDIEACRRRSPMIDPHPMINAADLAALLAEFRKTAGVTRS